MCGYVSRPTDKVVINYIGKVTSFAVHTQINKDKDINRNVYNIILNNKTY